MAPVKKEYRSVARTKKMIRAAFSELLGEKKKVETITVSELARRADIAKSTFYNHYEDVYAVRTEFEDELIGKLSAAFDAIEQNRTSEYGDYWRKIKEFVKENEELYRNAIFSSEARFFIEKLKNYIAKRFFENDVSFPFFQNKRERYVQVRFFTNACVDTMADYLRGTLNVTLDEVCEIMTALLNSYRQSEG